VGRSASRGIAGEIQRCVRALVESIFPWGRGKFGVRPSTFCPMADQLDLQRVSARPAAASLGAVPGTQAGRWGSVVVRGVAVQQLSAGRAGGQLNRGPGGCAPGAVSHHLSFLAACSASLGKAWQVIRMRPRPWASPVRAQPRRKPSPPESKRSLLNRPGSGFKPGGCRLPRPWAGSLFVQASIAGAGFLRGPAGCAPWGTRAA